MVKEKQEKVELKWLGKLERKRVDLSLDRLLMTTTLIYGAPKTGKTTFAASLPDCLVIETEPHGADYVEGLVLEVSNRDELREVWKELKSLPGREWKWRAIVLDTIDSISDWIEKDVAMEFGRDNLSGPSTTFGAEYARHRSEVINVLKQFQVFPAGLIVVAHSKGEGEKQTLNLPGKLSRAIMAQMNNVIYLGITDSGERMAFVSPTPNIEAGSRDPILTRIGKFKPSWEELKRLYDEEVKKAGILKLDLEEKKGAGKVDVGVVDEAGEGGNDAVSA